MCSFHWTVKAVKQVGKFLGGAWVEIIKTTTSAEPTSFEIFRVFKQKYGMTLPSVSTDQYFTCIKGYTI